MSEGLSRDRFFCEDCQVFLLHKRLAEFQKYIQPEVPIALVGLITRCEDNIQEITSEEGQKIATSLNVTYFESSPADQAQALEIFTYLARKVIDAK